MPFKRIKKDTPDVLTLKWLFHVKEYALRLDKKLCVGCQICSLACPKEAITLIKSPVTEGKKVEHAKNVLWTIAEDLAVPKNIRRAAKKSIDALDSGKLTPAVRASGAISVLDDASQDLSIDR